MVERVSRLDRFYLTLDEYQIVPVNGIQVVYPSVSEEELQKQLILYGNIFIKPDYYLIKLFPNDLKDFVQSQIGYVQYTYPSNLVEKAPMSMQTGIALIQKEWEVKIFLGDNELYKDLGRCQVVVDQPELEESWSMTAVVPIPIRIIPVKEEVE